MNGWRSGLFSLDHLLRDLAAHATARCTAENTEYPSDRKSVV